MSKLVDLFNKYRSIIAYLFWGVVTTVVNIGVFQFLSSGAHWNYQLANVIAWIVVAPSLDVLIYAEPIEKVYSQGVFAAIANSLTAVIVGALLVAAYCKTIAKKGSLDKE